MSRWYQGPLWYAPPDIPLWTDADFADYYTPWHHVHETPRVAHSTVHAGSLVVKVSTVFLMHNHRFAPEGPPILWETMVFGGPTDMMQQRYISPEAATIGHIETVREVWAWLDLQGTPELATVTTRCTWWREPVLREGGQ